MSESHPRMQSAITNYRLLGFWGVFALVCLRVVVGWHFYMEGVAKVRDGGFSSTGFLNAAKGPLAANFQAMIPDHDGKLRLKRKELVSAYDSYMTRVANSCRFSADQTEQAKKAIEEATDRWDSIADQWAPQIQEYLEGFERIETMSNDPKRSKVASLRAQRDDIETKWKGLVKPVLSAIDKSSVTLEKRLSEIAEPAQKASAGSIPFEIGGGPVSVRAIDKIIPIFDMSVGILLIIGLLTRVAGIAAGLFLVSVVLTQFPGYPGTLPTYYQAIEMMACFVVALADAGRYAGLDFFPWAFWNARAAAKA